MDNKNDPHGFAAAFNMHLENGDVNEDWNPVYLEEDIQEYEKQESLEENLKKFNELNPGFLSDEEISCIKQGKDFDKLLSIAVKLSKHMNQLVFDMMKKVEENHNMGGDPS